MNQVILTREEAIAMRDTILEMGRIIRNLDDNENCSDFWTLDGTENGGEYVHQESFLLLEKKIGKEPEGNPRPALSDEPIYHCSACEWEGYEADLVFISDTQGQCPNCHSTKLITQKP